MGALPPGGRVDILAVKDGESVGIEVETGKLGIVENVKNSLQSGFGPIIVVATDEKALRLVEKELGKAGLLGLGRVKVVIGEGSADT